jgi:hypothetical protein
MTRHRDTSPRFAICINADDQDLLTPLKIYRILPDESADEIDYIRVIDDEGEDYLYPRDNFILVSFPPEIEKTLMLLSKNEEL